MSSYAHTNGHGYQDDSSVAGSSKGQNAANGYSNEPLTTVAEPEYVTCPQKLSPFYLLRFIKIIELTVAVPCSHHARAALSHGSRLVSHLYESGFQRGVSVSRELLFDFCVTKNYIL